MSPIHNNTLSPTIIKTNEKENRGQGKRKKKKKKRKGKNNTYPTKLLDAFYPTQTGAPTKRKTNHTPSSSLVANITLQPTSEIA